MEELIAKADILIEALPYIKKFRGKEVIIKFGGSAMDKAKSMQSVLQGLAFMSLVGIRPILIHGGGSAITSNLKKAGIETKFLHGHRVTDKATITGRGGIRVAGHGETPRLGLGNTSAPAGCEPGKRYRGG